MHTLRYILITDKVDFSTDLSAVVSGCNSCAIKKDCTKLLTLRQPGQPTVAFLFVLRLATVPTTAERFSKARMLCLS